MGRSRFGKGKNGRNMNGANVVGKARQNHSYRARCNGRMSAIECVQRNGVTRLMLCYKIPCGTGDIGLVLLQRGAQTRDVPKETTVDGGKLGEYLVANAVARVGDIGIGVVGHIVDALPPAKSKNFHLGDTEKRSDDLAVLKLPHSGNAAKSAQSASAGKVEKECFGIVISIVCRCQQRDMMLSHERRKKVVSNVSCLFLNAAVMLVGKCRHIRFKKIKGKPVPLGKSSAKLAVSIGCRAAQLMIHMGDGKGRARFLGVLRKQKKQCRGIRTARKRRKNGGVRRHAREPVGGDKALKKKVFHFGYCGCRLSSALERNLVYLPIHPI